MSMALEGVRVLDLSRLAPGPYCSMLLGDFGADVLMIEAGGRASEGPGSRMEIMGDSQREAAYNALYRNKRSLALDLKDDRAKDIFYRLSDDADVVLEGFRPGVAKRLGVDYETLAARNPRLIYCALSGYGQTGPYAERAGHDLNYASLGGAIGVTGTPDGGPAIPLNLIADFAAGGLHAAFAICAALVYRATSGRGQHIDLAMSDGVLSLMTWPMSYFFATGHPVEPGSWLFNGGAPWYNVYQCADQKWISVAALEPRFYAALCTGLNCPQWIPDQFTLPLYSEMLEYYRATFATKSRAEWVELFDQHDACVMPVFAMEELTEDRHNLARQMIVNVPDEELGCVRQIGVAAKFSETPGVPRSTGPRVGQHTDDILRQLGYDGKRIQALRQDGVVG